MCDVMEGVLDKCLTPTTEMIANLIEIENAHINTNHPDFVGSADSLLNLFATGNDQEEQNGDKKQNYSLLPQAKNQNQRGSYKQDGQLDAEVIDEMDKEDEKENG